MHAGNLNRGLGGGGDDSSDWEEASEEGSESDALEVHGLPPGQDLLDIAAAAASAHDYVNGITKVRPQGCSSQARIGADCCRCRISAWDCCVLHRERRHENKVYQKSAGLLCHWRHSTHNGQAR